MSRLRGIPGLVIVAVAISVAATAGAQDVHFKALDTRLGAVVVPANPAYTKLPITFECFARLRSKDTYNILVACEDKPSPRHWELFTMPGTGYLTVYLPGRTPNQFGTSVDICDGAWHYIAMVLEEQQCRLYVDGVERASAKLSPQPEKEISGNLVVGALVTGDLKCNGWLAEPRLSKIVRDIKPLPFDELAADAGTIGLWHVGQVENGKVADAGPLHNAGRLDAGFGNSGPGVIPVAGGMSAAFMPLPPAKDVAPARAELKAVAARIHLRTVHADAVRNAILRQWSYDFAWIGKQEYPDRARQVWWQDRAALPGQVFDRQALIWPQDGGPLGTVLRRTTALLGDLTGMGADVTAVQEDLDRLKRAVGEEKPDVGTEAYHALYLAACALRREAELRNPLLDFDSILFVARGTFAGSVLSNPVNQDVQGGHFATQYFGFNALPGGGLYILRHFKTTPKIVNVLANSVVENGRLKGHKLDHGAFLSPDLSYDGKTIIFAWTENSEHRWIWSKKTLFHIFRVNVDGTHLRQLTDGAYNDFDPIWLPSGRIAFVSERRGGYIRCFAAYLKVRTACLFSMKADGSDIVPLSYFETDEFNPSVNNSGQLVYTRWDYVDRENCLGTRFWISRPDGTDPRSPHGNYPRPFDTFPGHKVWARFPDGRERDSRVGTPMVEMGIRAVPNSPLYICTAAPHHGEAFGSLCMLDVRRKDDGYMSQVKRITPDEPFPESEMPGRRQYKYGTPWPLSADFYLCNIWSNLALVDKFGNCEQLYDLRSMPCPQDERLRLISPIPLRARPKPPVLPVRTYEGERASPKAPKATIALINVYDSDLPFPKGVKIKWLRIVQDCLKSNHTMGVPMIGYERENTPRIPLGVVPVEKDGSAYFQAPVAKELIFQALDKNYEAVQSMRSVAYVHPGEQLTCQGCHEPPRQAPQTRVEPMALRRPPSPLEPEIGPVEPISYYRQIRPIFENTCVACHKKVGHGPTDMSYEAMRNDAFWFSGGMLFNMTTAYSGIHGGSRTIPGRFGARYCKLGRALMDPTHLKAVSPEDRHKVIVWLDCNSLRLGAYHDEAAQLRGELVWPELDVDPANPVGTEFSGAPLRHNFWNQNMYGPHAFLGTSHSKAMIYIMNTHGKIVWSYPVQNPQDVWMLPNGNILTTWLHGVKEITRDKRVVWQYTVQAPNEVPTCEPLPDGNVLIGIVGQCRLIEVNHKGKIVHQIQLSTTVKEPHAQFRMCRVTPQGTYLVPFMAEGAVREYDRDGKVIRDFPCGPRPVCAVRLDNGHTLISTAGGVKEFDNSGRIMWELTPTDIPDINVAILAGVQRLANGDTVVCNWGTTDSGDKVGAHIFEVTPDKRVVWQVTGDEIGRVAQCQLLTDDLKPILSGIER